MKSDANAALAAQIREADSEQRKADARRRYLLDELSYAASERVTLKNGELLLTDAFFDLCECYPVGAQDAAFFSGRLLSALETRGMPLRTDILLPPEKRTARGEHIVYVRNYYTDAAFDIFAKQLDFPTVSYADDFHDACHSVAEGLGDLCILPLRDESWEGLRTFIRMPEQYALSIRALCTVSRPGGDTLHCALCGRGILIPQDAPTVLVEFLIVAHEGDSYRLVQTVSSALGGEIVFADAAPDRYTEKTLLRVTYRLPRENLDALLLACRLFAPDAEILSIYAGTIPS